MATCTRGEACECVGDRRPHRIFCPRLNAERAYEPVDRANIAAWSALPAQLRQRCVRYLGALVPADVVDGWRAQRERGVAPGSESIRFHLEVGMAVRNALRDVVVDEQLPSRNWDDYYVGAIDELVAAPAPVNSSTRNVNKTGPFRQLWTSFWKGARKVVHPGAAP